MHGAASQQGVPRALYCSSGHFAGGFRRVLKMPLSVYEYFCSLERNERTLIERRPWNGWTTSYLETKPGSWHRDLSCGLLKHNFGAVLWDTAFYAMFRLEINSLLNFGCKKSRGCTMDWAVVFVAAHSFLGLDTPSSVLPLRLVAGHSFLCDTATLNIIH